MRLDESSSIKKIGCTAKHGGHDFDVAMTLKAMGQQQTVVQRLRVVKGSEGRVVAGAATR